MEHRTQYLDSVVTSPSLGASVGDPDMWSPQQPDRLYADEDGIYALTVQIAWVPNSSGQRSMGFVKPNGPVVYANGNNAVGGGFGSERALTSAGSYLAAGQFVQAFGFYNVGGSLEVAGCVATLRRIH